MTAHTESAREITEIVSPRQATLPIISGLSADLVPPALYATRRWYYSTPLWYYHAAWPSDHTSLTLTRPRVSEHCYELMDAGVRELCRLLHKIGIRTTGSCEGHFYGHDHYEGVWSELRREAPIITQAGLPVRDSESGEAMLFRDRAYALPWPDFDHFFAEAGASQGSGYVGLTVPESGAEVADRLASNAFAITLDHSPREMATLTRDEHLDPLLGGRYFAVTVQASSPESRDTLWRIVRERISAAIT